MNIPDSVDCVPDVIDYASDVINHSDEQDDGVLLFIKKVLIREIQDRTLLSYDEDSMESRAAQEFLLPPTLATQFVDHVLSYTHKPIVVLYDADRRVHKLLLGGCNFMIFTAAWKKPNLVGPLKKSYRSVYDVKTTKLSCAMITLMSVLEEDNTLEISDTDDIGGFQNNVGRLLLPHNIRPDYRRDIGKYSGTSVPVIYDQYGRIYSLTLGVGTHMLLMGLWKTKPKKRVTVAISGIDEETDTLTAHYELGMKLLLPKGLPMEFREWQPHGRYVVEHDDDNEEKRVHSIKREGGEGQTDIYLTKFWESRYDLVV